MDANTLENTLKNNQFVGGQQPSAADAEAFEVLKANPPSAETHPLTYAWFCLIFKFSDAVRASWAGSGKAAAKGGKKDAGKGKKEEKKADDDDLDLFGDDDDDGEVSIPRYLIPYRPPKKQLKLPKLPQRARKRRKSRLCLLSC